MKHIENANITEIEIAGVDSSDYPDFVDAYVENCMINGVPATEEELNYINYNMPNIAQEAAFESLIGKID